MCGRIASNISGADQLLEQFLLRYVVLPVTPRYNIAPGQQVLAVVQNEQGERDAVELRWGLVPYWAKDASIGYKMINARCETVAEKPAFRIALRKRRCIIPCTGFYEWRKVGKKREPYFFRLRGDALMALAGLWEEWRNPENQPVRTFTIVTTAANELVQPLHDRMPVVLNPESVNLWLDHSWYDLSLLSSLMQPYPSAEMQSYRVSSYVNSPANEGPECCAPLVG